MSRITAKTAVCGIFGHPVEHSMSPAIHNAAFEALELDFVYVAHDVAPDGLATAVAGIRALGYRGLSITIPHKSAALELVDEADPTAKGIGCINTVVNDDGVLKGFNSDGRGALKALTGAHAHPEGKQVVVLGSGGAARAIAMTLAVEAPPAELVVLGIVPGELDQLVADLNDRGRTRARGEVSSDDSIRSALATADILVQTTPIGMHPKTDASLVPPDALRPEITVFDAVYNPRRTKLLQNAAFVGCRVVEGVEMFLGQAVVQFELWTGQRAPVEVMRRIVEERL
jgi:shikimate dehydrogenase